MDSVEARFNRQYHYPYMFMNDEPFPEDAEEKIRKHTNAPVEFVVLPKELWGVPDYVDKETVGVTPMFGAHAR